MLVDAAAGDRLRSAAADIALGHGAADGGTCPGAQDRAQQLGIARRNQVAQRAAGQCPDNQPGRAIAAAAIVPVVRAAIDPVTAAELAFTIARTVAVIARGIIATIGRIGTRIIIVAIIGSVSV